jgi:DAACS family dicarboxylate/amino acid:cation (Na+ or H+) symporter
MAETTAAPPSRKPGGVSLPLQMLVGLIAGCAIGLLWPSFGARLSPVSSAFINALRMLIIPMIFSSIVLGIYNMGREIRVFGKVIGIAFLWFYIAAGTCMVVGLAMNAIFHPGVGADLTIQDKLPANAPASPWTG